MERHSFRLTLEDHILRKMDKKTYKATMKWLRFCRRQIENHYDKLLEGELGKLILRDLTLYGTSIIYWV
jgi:hypothetical protein